MMFAKDFTPLPIESQRPGILPTEPYQTFGSQLRRVSALRSGAGLGGSGSAHQSDKPRASQPEEGPVSVTGRDGADQRPGVTVRLLCRQRDLGLILRDLYRSGCSSFSWGCRIRRFLELQLKVLSLTI